MLGNALTVLPNAISISSFSDWFFCYRCFVPYFFRLLTVVPMFNGSAYVSLTGNALTVLPNTIFYIYCSTQCDILPYGKQCSKRFVFFFWTCRVIFLMSLAFVSGIFSISWAFVSGTCGNIFPAFQR